MALRRFTYPAAATAPACALQQINMDELAFETPKLSDLAIEHIFCALFVQKLAMY